MLAVPALNSRRLVSQGPLHSSTRLIRWSARVYHSLTGTLPAETEVLRRRCWSRDARAVSRLVSCEKKREMLSSDSSLDDGSEHAPVNIEMTLTFT